MNGLRQRRLSDLSVKLVGQPEDLVAAAAFQRQVFGQAVNQVAEVELLFHPGQGSFSRSVDCRVLVTDDLQHVPARVQATADIVVPSDPTRAAQLLTQQLHLASAEQQAASLAAA